MVYTELEKKFVFRSTSWKLKQTDVVNQIEKTERNSRNLPLVIYAKLENLKSTYLTIV